MDESVASFFFFSLLYVSMLEEQNLLRINKLTGNLDVKELGNNSCIQFFGTGRLM